MREFGNSNRDVPLRLEMTKHNQHSLIIVDFKFLTGLIMPVLTSNTHVTMYFEKQERSAIDPTESKEIYLLSEAFNRVRTL